MGSNEDPRDETMRKLFVGGLSYDTTEGSLRATFETVGPVEAAWIKKHRDTGKSRGFAFVLFVTEKDAAEALRVLDGKECDGRPMRLTLARPQDEDDRARFGFGRGRARATESYGRDPSRDPSQLSSRDSARDYPSRDYPSRDYPSRDYPSRDYPSRDYPRDYYDSRGSRGRYEDAYGARPGYDSRDYSYGAPYQGGYGRDYHSGRDYPPSRDHYGYPPSEGYGRGSVPSRSEYGRDYPSREAPVRHDYGREATPYGREGAPSAYGREGAPTAYGREGAPAAYGREGAPAAYGREGAPAAYGREPPAPAHAYGHENAPVSAYGREQATAYSRENAVGPQAATPFAVPHEQPAPTSASVQAYSVRPGEPTTEYQALPARVEYPPQPVLQGAPSERYASVNYGQYSVGSYPPPGDYPYA
eukprot:m.717854 g.717854  ORF g.717854 m.717854 type:complete len:417 (+) comp58809_c1_seq2:137-1387(+)